MAKQSFKDFIFKFLKKDEYTKLTKKIKDFYTGKSDKYINEKKIDMKNYSQKQEYEKANQAKNLINHLENARTTQTLLVDNKKSVDVLGVDIDNLDVVISCLLIRNGRIIGEVKKTLEPIDTSDYNEYLPQVILSVFSENEPSEEILVSHNFPYSEVIEKELSKKWSKKIKVKTPQRGWKKDLLDTAIIDAIEIRKLKLENLLKA